jgi:hypothetical protein
VLRKDRPLKLACGALIALGFIIFLVSSPKTTTVAPTTTLVPTTTAAATASRQDVVQTAPTAPTTTVVPTAVEGVVLSRTGSNTLPLFITGVVLVLLGTALELSARRRSTLLALTLRPIHTVGIADILHEMARTRQAATLELARASRLASARTPPLTRDTGAWRYRKSLGLGPRR